MPPDDVAHLPDRRVLITEPGVYDLTAEEYHADPVKGGSLSSTATRRLLDCPARYLAYVNGEEERSGSNDLDVGKAAHAKILGVGQAVHVVQHDGRTAEGKAERAAAAEAGAVVIKAEVAERIDKMAEALLAHPVARRLLDTEAGWTEQTIVWRDERTGIMRRAMLDYLPHWAQDSGLFIVPDYKTARSADPRKFERSMWDYGYHVQGEFYLDGVRALGLAGDGVPAFVFVVQEKTPPYVVSVVQYGAQERYWAAAQIQHALDTYRQCVKTGRWPGYTDEIAAITLPGYAVNQLQQQQDDHKLPIPRDAALREAS